MTISGRLINIYLLFYLLQMKKKAGRRPRASAENFQGGGGQRKKKKKIADAHGYVRNGDGYFKNKRFLQTYCYK